MKIEVAYKQGIGKQNEDTYLIDEVAQRFAVIDGATGLNGLSGKLAADVLKKALANTARTFQQAVQDANTLIQREVAKQGLRFSTMPKTSRSTCSFVVMNVQNNRLRYMQAGDCMLFIQYKDGSIRQLTYDHVAKLDQAAIKAYQYALEHFTQQQGEKEVRAAMAPARESIQQLLVANRNLLNTPEGYGIFDGTEESLSYFDAGQITLQDAQKILLLSDGLQLPGEENGWLETAQFAFKHGAQALEAEVCRLENEDPYCLTYPRLKFADDKTAVLIHI